MTFGRYDYAAWASFVAYAAGSVVVPVALVALARDLGFALEKGGMTAGGALHFARTATMVAGLLLSGFFAGRWGMRRSLGVSVVLMAVGIGLCAVAPLYGVLLLAVLIAGTGEGVLEGLATPFVQNLHPREPGRYINFAHSFWSVGVLVTVLSAGAAMSLGVSWRVVVAACCVAGLGAAAALLLPETRGREYPEHPEPLHWQTVMGYARAIFGTRRFWLFYGAMFVAGGGEFCLTFWTASYIQLNFVDAAWAGGVGTACFASGMVLGRIGFAYFVHQQHLRHLILSTALAGAVVTVFFPFITSLWLLLGLLFVSGVASAPYWPSVQSYATDRLPHLDTTMMFILLSCAGVPGCGVLTWLMGIIGDVTGSLRIAFYLVPACYLVLAALIGYDWLFPSRDTRHSLGESANVSA